MSTYHVACEASAVGKAGCISGLGSWAVHFDPFGHHSPAQLPSAFAVAVGLLTAGFLGVVGLVGPAFVGAGLAVAV